MDLSALRSFVAVATGATVTQAAADAHVSQPTMTRALQRIEAEVGAPLFDHVGRGLRLNANGEGLLFVARRMLADFDHAVHEIAARQDPSSGTVRLGFLAPLASWLIPELLGTYRRRRPLVDFELRQDGADRIFQALVDGRLDLLITSSDSHDPSVAWEHLFDEELVLVVDSGHRLAARRGRAVPAPVHLADAGDETFILFAPGYSLRRRTEALCTAAGFTPRIGFEGHDLTTLYGLVAAGCGVGIFPAHPQLRPGLCELPLAPAASRPVGVAWCPGAYRPAAAETFRHFVLETAAPANRARLAATGG